MKPLTIAVDFDGTIVKHEYPAIGADIGAIPYLKKAQAAGHKIILWTMRSGYELADAVGYLANAGITLHAVNKNPGQEAWTTSPKCYAHVYIDDAALGTPLCLDLGQRPYVDWSEVGPRLMELLGIKEDEAHG